MKLRPYQKIIVDHIVANKKCSVWASMGMGKTISTLTALERINLLEDIYPVLVLAPLRVAKTTWPEEVRKWDHTRHLRVSPIVGTHEQRTQAVGRTADVYTTNYENLPWLVDHFGERWPFRTVVADESTKLKSFRLRQGGARAQALGTVSHTKVKRHINLTGTPASNGLSDLWGQQWFIDAGKRLGRTFTSFRDRWFRRKYDGYGYEPMKFAQKEIEEVLGDVCLTVDAKDWFDLKAPIVTPVYVELPPVVRKLYNEMEDKLFMELEGGHAVEAFSAAAKTQKLLQLCSGAVYVDPLTEGDHDTKHSREWCKVHDEKLDALEEIIEEAAGMPVLVAYHFKSDLARLLKRFPQSRALDDSSTVQRDWNEGKIPVLLAHPACLHPTTEVLTELRGWVKLIEVKNEDRVYDGTEFVSHSGCHYSGFKPVIELFGITMTLNHKILISGKWVEAKDVGTDKGTRAKARYIYEGDDDSLRKVFRMSIGVRDTKTEFRQTQSKNEKPLPTLPTINFPLYDKHPFLEYMEGLKVPSGGFERQKLRGARNSCLRGVEQLQKLLQRYVPYLQKGVDNRTQRRKWGLQQGELSVGDQYGTTSKQENQQIFLLSRRADTPRRGLPTGGGEQNEANNAPSAGHEFGRSYPTSESLPVRDEPEGCQRAHVYDLVDCGPRQQFLIRNAEGEIFISHNSAGHGLNLQFGGNILVYFSHDWNLENRLQILERIGPVRQLQAGLDRPVFIYNIIARNSADEMVIARTESKKEVQDILLEAMKKRRGK